MKKNKKILIGILSFILVIVIVLVTNYLIHKDDCCSACPNAKPGEVCVTVCCSCPGAIFRKGC